MKLNEIKEFTEYLKTVRENKFYISQFFIDWSCGKFKYNELESTEIFDLNKKKIISKIKDYIDSCNSKYIIPNFFFDEFDEDVLISSKFLNGKYGKQNLEYKLEWRNKFYQLIKQLDWREFEILGKLILKENHIDNVKITKSQKDQGIDFYGYFKFKEQNILPRFYNYFNFRIIGQIKHSENNNGVDHQKVASFGTEINKLRKTKDNTYFVNLEQEFIKSELPIVGIFITNSYYPTKAKDFANEYGIIYWDGEQISQDLATKENIDKIFDETIQDLTIEKFKNLIVEISK